MTRTEELENRLRLLVNFGGVVSKETNLNRLLELIAEQVKTILVCDRCSVFILDRHTNELWSKVALGMQHTEIRVPFGKGIVGHVASSGQIINIKDAYQDTRFTHDIDRLTGYRTRSILAVPMKNVSGHIIGVFEAMNKSGNPFDIDDEGILQLVSSLAASGIENAQLYESLSKSQLETIYRLAVTAEYRDQHDTAIHLRHISEYSSLIAQGLGMPEREVENIRYASPLHDIGKVGIADAILLKPGRLTAEEFEEMKKHTLYGAKILCNAESSLLQIACKVAGSHHEKFDGTGYPARLKGEQIPLFARIVSVADVFDALCMPRVYKPKWDTDKAREYILEEKGKAFDPAVVEAFDRMYGEILKMHAIGDGKTTIIPGITKELNRHNF
ncbi:MAG: HD domain-containing protein [Elusimicrobiales bacterium]|nr:HD domain-containing protein [Elusimicrobiales bacterium]